MPLQVRLNSFKLFLVLALPFALALKSQTTVDGTIHDITGAVLRGASEELSTGNALQVPKRIIAADGYFRFNAVEPDAYRLEASAPNYYPSAYEFVLRQRQPLSIYLEMERKGSVSAQVGVHEHYQTV